MDIQKELYEFIKENFGIEDEDDFTYEVNLFDYGYVDSLGAVEIIAYIEEHWNIEISQKDLTLYPMNSINEIAEVIARKL